MIRGLTIWQTQSSSSRSHKRRIQRQLRREDPEAAVAEELLKQREVPMFLQEYLLRKALREEGIDTPDLPIIVDHLNGLNFIGGVPLEIKYPASYLDLTHAMPRTHRYRYVFCGNMAASGARRKLLAAFVGPYSYIEESNYGRDPTKKYSFNRSYYERMRQGIFALCPHQVDWTGPPDTAWTYRFIEATFAEVLPVCFRAAPCGSEFLRGFHYYWDDETHSLEGYQEKVDQNKALTARRFFLSTDEVEAVKRACAFVSLSEKVRMRGRAMISPAKARARSIIYGILNRSFSGTGSDR